MQQSVSESNEEGREGGRKGGKERKEKKKEKEKQTLGRGENLVSIVTRLLDSNIQISVRNHKVYKETGNYGSFKGRK